MIFFNPYFEDLKGTEHLIDTFFDYAETNLRIGGVVTLMWNMDRTDALAKVDIEAIATKHKFRIVQQLSGHHFAKLTGFVHLKNSSSFNRAVKEAKEEGQGDKSIVVSKKATDTILLFRHQSCCREIPESNILARTLVDSLRSV